MRAHRPLAAAGLVALSLTIAGCHSKSTASTASTLAAPSTAAAPSATPATSTAAAPSAPAASAPAVSAAASAPAVSAAASAPAGAGGSGAVTFSGSYTGTLNKILCVGSGPNTTAQFNASFTGNAGYPGNIASTEFGFEGPDNTQFDSGYLNKALDTDGKGFDVDGIVAKDEGGKSVTMHGTLVCP